MPHRNILGEVIIDYLPEKIARRAERQLEESEDVWAAIKGKKGEALVATDRGVHIIKGEGTCRFFAYEEISGVRISRVMRRGTFTLLLKGKRCPGEGAAADSGPFAADPSDNVVNFPFAKMPLFKKAAERIEEQLDAGTTP